MNPNYAAPKRQIPTKKPLVHKSSLGKTGLNFYGDQNSVKHTDGPNVLNITQNNFNIKLDANLNNRQRKFESRDGNSFNNPHSQKVVAPKQRATQQNFFENSAQASQQRMYNSVIHSNHGQGALHFHNRSDYSIDLVSKVNQKHSHSNNYISVNKKNVMVVSNANQAAGSYHNKTQQKLFRSTLAQFMAPNRSYGVAKAKINDFSQS